MPSEPPGESPGIAERRAKVLEEFRRDFPSREEARKDLLVLRYSRGRQCPCYTPARSIFKKLNGKPGTWYADILPQLVLHAGWFTKLEDAKAFAGQVEAASKSEARRTLSKARLTMSQEEVLEGFRKEFPSLEEARKDLLVLQEERRRSRQSTWYNPALSTFKKPNGKHGRWYAEVLPQLVLHVGWFTKLEDAKAFAGEVRAASNRAIGKAISKALLKTSKEEVLEGFRKDFPSLEEARKDLSVLQDTRSKQCTWYTPARSIFKKLNGKPGTWYADILPQLVLHAGWFTKLEDAKAFAGEVRTASNRAASKALSKALRTMTREEVLEGFRKEFLSLEEARKDLLVLRELRSRQSTWYTPALSLFKKPNGKNGGWYAEVLPQLVLHVGWFTKLEDAKAFAGEVRAASAKEGARKNAKTQKTRNHASMQKKERNYAIVVGSLNHAAKGLSFEKVTPLLSLGSTETASSSNGMARAVISASGTTNNEMSPGELLRLKMHTDNWGGNTAEAYSGAFSHIAPYLTTRLLLLHAFELVKSRAINPLRMGASLMSGPGEVHGALEGIRAELDKNGIGMPSVVDVDMERDMLGKSQNPNRVQANAARLPIRDGSLDFVECSSLYQFDHRKYPTVARDTLMEAARVLEVGGVLMLTATAKKFSEEFEQGLKLLGFSIVTPANTRIMLTSEAKERILYELGPDLLGKAERATASTHYLVAIKARKSSEEPPADLFRFKRVQELPAEANTLAAQSRRLDRDLGVSTDAAILNIERMFGILDRLPPEAHERHAELIQVIMSKYLLDPEPVRPKNGGTNLTDNAARLVGEAERVGRKPTESDEKYFALLRRITKTHQARLLQARQRTAA